MCLFARLLVYVHFCFQRQRRPQVVVVIIMTTAWRCWSNLALLVNTLSAKSIFSQFQFIKKTLLFKTATEDTIEKIIWVNKYIKRLSCLFQESEELNHCS